MNNHSGKTVFSIDVRDENAYNNYVSRRKSSVLNEISDRIRSILNHEDDEIDYQDGIYRIKCQDVIASAPGFNNSNPELQNFKKRSSSKIARELNTSEIPKKKIKTVDLRKWFVLCGSFVNLFLTAGFPFNMSVLYVDFLEEFGRSKAETSLVQSVCTGIFFIGGIITGSLVKRYGTKLCGFIGGLLCFVGIFAAYFATNIIYLVVSIGVLAGFGFSLNVICASASVAQNFSGRNKVLALSFVSLGSGLGGLSFPLLLQLLSLEYRWRGCLLIVSGIIMHLCACAAISGKSIGSSSVVGNITESDNQQKDDSFFKVFKILLKNKIFIAFCIALSLVLSTFNAFLIFFIDYFQSKGFERDTGVWMYSTMNLVSSAFRFLPGLIARNPKVPKLAIPAFFSATGATAMVILPFCYSFMSNIVTVSVFGLSLGGIVTVMSITTLELVGEENYPTGFGFTLAVIGIVNSIAGPVSGLIRDITGSYEYSVLLGAGSVLLACVILTTIAILHTKYGKNQAIRHNMEIEVRRKSRRRSSILPWKKSVDLGFVL